MQHKIKTREFYHGKPQGRKSSNFFGVALLLSTMSDKDRKPKYKMSFVASSYSSPVNLSFSSLEQTSLSLQCVQIREGASLFILIMCVTFFLNRPDFSNWLGRLVLVGDQKYILSYFLGDYCPDLQWRFYLDSLHDQLK